MKIIKIENCADCPYCEKAQTEDCPPAGTPAWCPLPDEEATP